MESPFSPSQTLAIQEQVCSTPLSIRRSTVIGIRRKKHWPEAILQFYSILGLKMTFLVEKGGVSDSQIYQDVGVHLTTLSHRQATQQLTYPTSFSGQTLPQPHHLFANFKPIFVLPFCEASRWPNPCL